MRYSLGIDLGTSGARAAVIDEHGAQIIMVRGTYHTEQTPQTDANAWWDAVHDMLNELKAQLGADMGKIERIAVAGTSGSMVLTDKTLTPITPALMYHSKGFDPEATHIAKYAPKTSITRGSNSALARMLRLQSLDPNNNAAHICHQADFIVAKLLGAAGHSDDTNTLKLGFDPETQTWPHWFKDAGVKCQVLPKVHRVGAPIAQISSHTAQTYGLPKTATLIAGATDSIAAFLATGASQLGDAVTSLGTTLVLKILSNTRIDDPSRGVYSHRVGDHWLVGGASNTGAGVLLDHFSADEIKALSEQIDIHAPTGLSYYPLSQPGERFPFNDPNKAPCLEPRPESKTRFLQAIFEGIAKIEALCFETLAELNAPAPRKILTAGGGSVNPVWLDIRKQIITPNISVAPTSEASLGMAQLCLKAKL